MANTAKAGTPGARKVPVRQCLGCREHKPKRELIRVVRSPEGQVSLDRSGKMNGRGAYPSCLQRAVKTRALERAFGTAVPAEVLDRLSRELEQDDEA